jgi:hypothetical protein
MVDGAVAGVGRQHDGLLDLEVVDGAALPEAEEGAARLGRRGLVSLLELKI